MRLPYRRFPALAFALLVAVRLAGPAVAQTTPQGPSSAQPNLPQAAAPQAASPLVESIVGRPRQTVLEVHKRPIHHASTRHARYAHRHRGPVGLERPALAGVELLAPLPPAAEPPHFTVPTPAYPLDSVASAFLMPPPPVVCHRVRREPGLPDPHLYREVTVACEPDNP